MAKLTNEQRIEIYNKRNLGLGYSQLALEYGIRENDLKYLVRLISKHGPGILRNGKNKYYSPEIKEVAINRVLKGNESIVSVAIDIGLIRHGILCNWIKSYKENGYNVAIRKRGRHGRQEEIKGGSTKGNRRVEASEPTPSSRERILKKIGCLSYGTKEERITEIVKAITQLRQELDLSLAFILDAINSNDDLPHIARSVYYYTLSKTDKDLKNEEIMLEIKNIFHENNGGYGYRRIHLELLNKGYKLSHSKVKRLMSRMKLYGRNPSPKQRYNSYKGDMNGECRNLLLRKRKNAHTGRMNEKRDFSTASVNEKWTTDVSEFKIKHGKLYLSPVMDMHSREIVGYDISANPNLLSLNRMLDMAFLKHKNLKGLIFHSDQGWQYQHHSYHKRLEEKGIIQSMSRKGNCLDNSPMENFFGRMKNEMFYGHEDTFSSLEELKQAMTDYIDYHNSKRLSLKGKGLTPVQIRNQALRSV